MKIHNPFDLSGKVAIVTGAGRGLGAAMAKGLAMAGASVVCAARTESEVSETAQTITQSGGLASAYSIDVRVREKCFDLVAQTASNFGRLDVVVINHGIGGISPAEEIEQDDWQRIIDINLTGCFYCAQAAGKHMIKQGTGGSIIMTSSNASLVGFRGLTGYGASKGGVDQLARQLAVDWGQHNIRVNTINPGYMSHKMRHRGERAGNQGVDEFQLKMTPLARIGEPDELIGPVVFLASDASSFVTGHSIPVDGGYTIF